MPHLLDVTMLWGRTSGGVRRYITAKQDWFRTHSGWQHTVMAPGAKGEGQRPIDGWPIPFSNGYKAPLNRKKGVQAIAALQPDLIEVGDPYLLAWSSLDVAKRLRIPVVGFCHSNLEVMVKRWTGDTGARLARRYLLHLYNQFDLVLAPSQATCQALRSWGLMHVECQPLGVDTEVFHPGQCDPLWRHELGLPHDARVLIYAGRFGPEKNLHVLTQCVAQLGEPYVLIALGAGPSPPKGPRVKVLPFTNDKVALARALASADVFVHAGDQETFGLAALEAMACGCPVVALKEAGLAELIRDKWGACIPAKTAEQFAQGIERAWAQGLQSKGQAARQAALAHGWSFVLPQLFQRYQTLLEAQ